MLKSSQRIRTCKDALVSQYQTACAHSACAHSACAQPYSAQAQSVIQDDACAARYSTRLSVSQTSRSDHVKTTHAKNFESQSRWSHAGEKVSLTSRAPRIMHVPECGSVKWAKDGLRSELTSLPPYSLHSLAFNTLAMHCPPTPRNFTDRSKLCVLHRPIAPFFCLVAAVRAHARMRIHAGDHARARARSHLHRH
eukprot:6195660-Pleurochrysis_carterae.AAC.1